MSDLFENVDWPERIRENLPEWVYSTDYVSNLITVVANEINKLYEDGVQEAQDAAHIETAINDAISRHAENVGISRQSGESDTEVRQQIGLEIAINQSGGTIDDIQNLMVAGAWIEAGEDWATETIEIIERPDVEPAFFRITIDQNQLDDVDSRTVRDIIDRAKVAGVRFELVAGGTFGYVDIDSNTDDLPNIEGYGDATDPDVGGTYSGLVVD